MRTITAYRKSWRLFLLRVIAKLGKLWTRPDSWAGVAAGSCCEKRLARLLLLLAHFGKEGVPEIVIPKISQETLAEMMGTTRSRVSFFMNRFRKLGFLDYGENGLQVHSSLLNVVLHD
jgi:CRP-like cAMP-binding protein